MTHVAWETKIRSVVRSRTYCCIHVLETLWQSDMRSCFMPGQPTHLVQKLNVGTVELHFSDDILNREMLYKDVSNLTKQ